jgi:hypothetical protein
MCSKIKTKTVVWQYVCVCVCCAYDLFILRAFRVLFS